MIVLSEDDVVELTGKRRPSAQARVLDFMGIPYRPRPNGSLVVLRIHVETVETIEGPRRGATLAEPQLVFEP
jgi:hypothetical protein